VTQNRTQQGSGVEAFKKFIAKVEEIFHRRQKEAEEGWDRLKSVDVASTSERVRKWTWEELYYFYPPLRDMRVTPEKYARPPLRDGIEEIAELLLCTFEERNELLIAAGYAPHEPYINGPELEYALKTAKNILNYMPFPAIVITRDDVIHRWNDDVLTLFNVSHEYILNQRTEDRTILWYVFNPEAGAYQVFTNWGKDKRKWYPWTAAYSILRFKAENILCQNDDWYIKRVSRLMSLPSFAELWLKINIDTAYKDLAEIMPPGLVVPEYVTHIFTRKGKEFRIRIQQIDYTGRGYPKILIYTPDDENARHVFEKLGLRIPNTGIRCYPL
jgi:hypothetical protein